MSTCQDLINSIIRNEQLLNTIRKQIAGMLEAAITRQQSKDISHNLKTTYYHLDKQLISERYQKMTSIQRETQTLMKSAILHAYAGHLTEELREALPDLFRYYEGGSDNAL